VATILIADGVRENLVDLRAILTGDGHEVRTASDGQECLRSVAEQAPDVIILATTLPEPSGAEVCRLLRADESTAEIPILMISASEGADEIIRCLELGALDCVTQPVNRRILLARVRSALRIKAAQEEKDQLLAKLEESYLLLEAVTENLERVSLEDRLTGVGNRRSMETELERSRARAQRYQRPYATILVDIDFFKKYNDHYGHQAGDVVLKQVADALGDDLRETDGAYRYGGEEFLVLLPETEAARAEEVAERLRQRVEALGIPHCVTEVGCVTISLGIGCETAEADAPAEWEEVVRRADSALYRAKSAGRNCVVMG
jgi:two-component system cell cycle response regulator